MGRPRHIPTGWVCSELPAHPPCTASHLGCPGLSFPPSQPSAPALTLPTWAPGHFAIRELSFGEFFRDQAAGTGGTSPPRVWGGESWTGMVPISTGTLSSTSTAHLRLCSKWRPWNICINNKQIHTKYIPTTWVGISRKSRNSHHASRIKRTNKSYYMKETSPNFKSHTTAVHQHGKWEYNFLKGI